MLSTDGVTPLLYCICLGSITIDLLCNHFCRNDCELLCVCLTLSRLSVGACKIRLKVQVDHAPQAPVHDFLTSDGCRGSGDHPGLCQSSRLLDGFGSRVTLK